MADSDYSYGQDSQAARAAANAREYNRQLEERAQRNANGEDWGNGPGTVYGEAFNKLDPRLNFINPGSADYGGSRGAANEYRERALEGMAGNDAAQQRSNAGLMGAYAGMRGEGGAQASENAYLSGREARFRNQQMDALGLMAGAAAGNAPSVAAYQTKIGQQDALSNFVGSQGQSRGLAAMGGAYGTGATATGLASGNLGMSGAVNRGTEIAQELGQFGKTAGQVAGQDLTRLGMANQMAQFNAGLSNDWKLGQAGLMSGYAGLANQQNAIDQQWLAEAQKPGAIQFQLDQEAAGWEAGAQMDKAVARITKDAERARANESLVGGIAQAGLTAIGSLAGPVGAAAGGMAGSAIGAATKKYY